ncbi:SDR family oxidoreductase [Aquibium sp. LZ166]|uniref:SDR family oxidoreductase n=1 Tax=Aquibium pacificus TaxID=3153579 RepID=A0ABV3SRV7_9HYPH
MQDRNKRLDGRIVLVTGAAGGIGAQIARQAAGEGARVIISDVRRDDGQKLAEELGSPARFVAHDVGDEDAWARLAEVCKAEGGVGGLVNNAGIFDPRPIAKTDVAFFERNMQINVLGTFLGIRFIEQAAAPSGASVVNLSSYAGLRGTKGIAYTASKWAVRGMSRTAAVELAPRNIRVNSIHPAFISTPILDAMTPENFGMRRKSIPLGRAGTVGDVADLVMFLLSDESAFITGAETAIDGGLSA